MKFEFFETHIGEEQDNYFMFKKSFRKFWLDEIIEIIWQRVGSRPAISI